MIAAAIAPRFIRVRGRRFIKADMGYRGGERGRKSLISVGRMKMGVWYGAREIGPKMPITEPGNNRASVGRTMDDPSL